MRFGSVCSGIEAASMAWMPLGWEPAWFSEIEPFPCAVLKHHHPDVPNHGDMTTLPARILAGEVEAPDVLVGGTPCQSFSVAGLRQGLKDPRGQLTRTYVEICDVIDTVRAAAGKPPVTLVYENVPGILSDRDNAFGNFLGALSGEDGPLEPPGGKWTNAGLVCGPTRDLAWRVLDAQYFGVAQRRRRVFLVGHSRTGVLRPVKVLLVEQGVQRHSPPSREAGQGSAAAAGTGAQGGSGGLGAGSDGGRGVVAFNMLAGNRRDGTQDKAYISEASFSLPLDCSGQNPDRWQGGTGVAHVVAPPRAVAFTTRGRDDGLSVESQDELAYALKNPGAGGRSNDRMIAHVVAPPLTATQADVAGPLDAHYFKGPGSRQGGEREYVAHVVAPPQTEYPEVAEVCGTISDGAHNGGGLNGQDAYTGRVLPVAIDTYNQTVTGDITQTLCSRGDTPGGNAHLVPAVLITKGAATHPEVAEVCGTLSDGAHHGGGLNGQDAYTGRILPVGSDCYNGTLTGDVAATLSTPGSSVSASGPTVMEIRPLAVRRLVPVEAERLQGFPDDYTRIPWKNKPASECPDGPRYKALGNSMAVPVMHWVGQQIQKALA